MGNLRNTYRMGVSMNLTSVSMTFHSWWYFTTTIQDISQIKKPAVSSTDMPVAIQIIRDGKYTGKG